MTFLLTSPDQASKLVQTLNEDLRLENNNLDHSIHSVNHLLVDMKRVVVLQNTSDYLLSYRRSPYDKTSHTSIYSIFSSIEVVEEIFEFDLRNDRDMASFIVLLNRTCFDSGNPQFLSIYSMVDNETSVIISNRLLKWFMYEKQKEIHVPIRTPVERLIISILTSPVSVHDCAAVSLVNSTQSPFAMYLLDNPSAYVLSHYSKCGRFLDEASPMHVIQVFYSLYTSSGTLGLFSSNHTLVSSLDGRNGVFSVDVMVPEEIMTIELTNAQLSSSSLEGVTVYLDEMQLPLVSVLFNSQNQVITFSTMNPFGSSYKYYASNDMDVLKSYFPPSAAAEPVWSEETGSLAINTKGVLAEWIIAIPSPRPTLLVIGFYYYGSIDVAIGGKVVASFRNTSLISYHDFFSYPVSLLENYSEIVITVLNTINTQTAVLETYAFFDMEESVMIRQSYLTTNLPFYAKDFDLLTANDVESQEFSYSFRNSPFVLASSAEMLLFFGTSTVLQTTSSIQYVDSEFNLILPTSTNTYTSLVVHSLPYYSELGVLNHVVTLYVDQPAQFVELIMRYTNQNHVCESEDAFPSVPQGVIASVPCGDAQWGVKYRSCLSTGWQSVQSELCRYHTPVLDYGERTFFVHTTIPRTFKPTVIGHITGYQMNCNMEIPGISINETTGDVTVNVSDMTIVTCTIMGYNSMVSAYTSLQFIALSPYCVLNGKQYGLGSDVSIPCGEEYVGSITARCKYANNTESGGTFVLYENTCAFNEPKLSDITTLQYCYLIFNTIIIVSLLILYMFIKKELHSCVCSTNISNLHNIKCSLRTSYHEGDHPSLK